MPDWTVPLDDILCTRLRSCTVCGRRADVLDVEVRRVGALALATTRCLRCRNADAAGETLAALLETRYGRMREESSL
jgi:hypothetical protein